MTKKFDLQSTKRKSSCSSKHRKSNSNSKYRKSNSSFSERSSIYQTPQQNQNTNIEASLSDLFKELCFQFSSQNTNRNCLVQVQEALDELNNNMIGKIYIITGVSQCGKLSTVLYALKDKPKINVLIINCNIFSTQTQFISKLLKQMEYNSHQNDQNQQYQGLLKRVINQKINFNQLTSIVQRSKTQFVIYLRNSEQLTECTKQVILYNLIEWVSKKSIKKKVGLVISSTKLSLLQMFQKRVRSRFCGRSIQIQRIGQSQKIIQIIEKRIQFLIQKKKNNKRSIGKKKIYVDPNFEQLKTKKNYKKIKQKQKVYSRDEQIQFLQFIKSGILNNKKFRQYLNSNLQDQIIPISFILQIFQHIFVSIDQNQFLKWKNKDLEEYIMSQFLKQIQFQFPTFNIQVNYLQNLNETQIMILVMIYSMLKHKQYPIKLSQIYKKYRGDLHSQVYHCSNGSSQNYPQLIIKRSLLNLNLHRIIKFQKDNYDIWNTQIYLLWPKKNVQQGLQYLKKKGDFPDIFQQIINNRTLSHF